MDAAITTLLILTLGYEGVALFNKKRGDTISENNWSIRDRALWGRILIDTFIIWCFWHLMIDPTFFVQGAGVTDLFILGLGILWSYWSWGYSRNRQKSKEL